MITAATPLSRPESVYASMVVPSTLMPENLLALGLLPIMYTFRPHGVLCSRMCTSSAKKTNRYIGIGIPRNVLLPNQ